MEQCILAAPSRRSILRLFPISCRSTSGKCSRIRLTESQFYHTFASSSSPTKPKTGRAFHSSSAQRHSARNSSTNQAYPLSGYYSDVLSFQYEQQKPAPPSSAASHTQTVKQDTGRELSKEEKMSIVFGTRLAGPGYESTPSRYNPNTMPPESTWRTINGVPIPPRPAEPDNCCMSGCVHCVWDDFRDDLEHWAARVKEARAKAATSMDSAAAPTVRSLDMRQKPRNEVANASLSMDDDGGGSNTNWDIPSETGGGAEDLFADIPVGIREFMKIEKKLREKKVLS